MEHPLLLAFFEDLARLEEGAESDARETIAGDDTPIWSENVDSINVLRSALRQTEQREAFARVVREMVHIAVHSALVSIDGGAESASAGRMSLVDADGQSLGEGLHELYVDYLIDTQRM